MKIFKSLMAEIKELFNRYDIHEEIDFKISNIENFDYQVNNLVKHQKHKNNDQILNEINSLLSANEMVESFEITNK